MTGNKKAMVLAPFVADALALGPHWLYNTDKITEKFGRVKDITAPLKGSYHVGKRLGDFTHYGDQTLVLLKSIAEHKGFDAQAFIADWKAFMESYTGYKDDATEETLANLAKPGPPNPPGSFSEDLSAAGRIAPVLFFHGDDPETCIKAVRAQTAATHNNPIVVDAAAFFGWTALKILAGASPVQALEDAAKKGHARGLLEGWFDTGKKSAGEDTLGVIKRLGQNCHAPSAFPSLIHLLYKYEKDLEQGLVENVMAGGDSAGRGMLFALVAGAHLGMEAIPQRWLKAVNARRQIEAYLGTI